MRRSMNLLGVAKQRGTKIGIKSKLCQWYTVKVLNRNCRPDLMPSLTTSVEQKEKERESLTSVSNVCGRNGWQARRWPTAWSRPSRLFCRRTCTRSWPSSWIASSCPIGVGYEDAAETRRTITPMFRLSKRTRETQKIRAESPTWVGMFLLRRPSTKSSISHFRVNFRQHCFMLLLLSSSVTDTSSTACLEN